MAGFEKLRGISLGARKRAGGDFSMFFGESDVFNKNLINCSQGGQSFFVSYFKKGQDFLKG